MKLDRIDVESLASNPRATFSAWKKYEPIVLAAFAQHPRPYIYQPSSLAPTTVASRLRDAIRGAIAFSYCEPTIPVEELKRWYSEIIIKNDNSQVYVGPAEQTQETLIGAAKSTTPASPYVYTHLTLDEVIAFTVLLSTGRILGPVTVTSPPDLSLLPQRPNVEVLTRPDGSVILL